MTGAVFLQNNYMYIEYIAKNMMTVFDLLCYWKDFMYMYSTSWKNF